MKNLRAFKISFLGATNTKGSRVKIKDLRHNKSKIIDYDHTFSNTKEVAENFLKSKKIYCDCFVSTENYYLLLTDDFATQIDS